MKKAPCKRECQARVCFAKREDYQKFMEAVAIQTPHIKREYTYNERVIITLNFQLGWNREKIRDKSGLSVRFVRETIQKIYENEL